MKKMRVVIIMPSWNPRETIFRALKSLKNQKWAGADWSLCIINDASTENAALERMEKLEKSEEHVTLIHLKKNGGPARARNVGIKWAMETGVDWIGFLDDDDEWPAKKWEISMAAALENPELVLIGGEVKIVVVEGVVDPIDKYLDENNHVVHVYLGALITKPEVFEKIGLIDESMRYSEDFDWINRVRESGLPMKVLHEETLIYHWHGDNSIQDKNSDDLLLLETLVKSIKRRRASGKAIMKPLVSEDLMWRYDVVIPTYNGAKFIERAIRTATEQTLAPERIIVVDDGSTDGTIDLIEALENPMVTLIRQENSGVSVARNVGWEAATSVWIAFLDQDDEWMPNKAEHQLAALRVNPDVHWASCMAETVLDPGYQWKESHDDRLLKPHKCVVPSGWMITRVALIHTGGFDKNKMYGGDFDLASKMRTIGQNDLELEQVLVKKHHGTHNESNKSGPMKNELLQNIHSHLTRLKKKNHEE